MYYTSYILPYCPLLREGSLWQSRKAYVSTSLIFISLFRAVSYAVAVVPLVFNLDATYPPEW